ncbi:unnamed protein product [Cuscuta campestris]|uniref:Putative plant transposon protein domain-containing protein n=1 Tax=Cuscuta campestris TaxID=132261 RepID=A0A484M9Z6_9ASTE|nr:unnamed protein product [Cuscuta campestris]
MGKDKNRAGASSKSKAKSRAPTTSTEERLYYGDGSYLWFDSKEERTCFLTFFSKRVVAPPRIIPERYPELQGYDDLDAQLHQAGLWPFVSRARKEINPALIRVFYSNLWHEGNVLYSLVKSTPIELSIEQLGRIADLPYQGDDVSLYGGEDWVLNNDGLILNELGITELIRHASGRPTIHFANPDGRLLLYIVSRIIKPRKHDHTIMSGEDLKLIHAIMHSAPINWAKFVMINMTIAASTDHDHLLPYPFVVMDILERFKLIHAIMHSAPINWAKFVMINMTIAASTDHDHLLPYPFVVMDILERFKVTTTVGPLTKATKIWAVSTQTFKKRSDNSGPATAVQRHHSAAGLAEAHARANLASIANSLNRLHFKVGRMDGYLERLDEAVQRQGHAMNAYFQRVNYVPPPYHGTFFGQVYGDEDEEDGSYAPPSSPDEDEFDDAVDGVHFKYLMPELLQECKHTLGLNLAAMDHLKENLDKFEVLLVFSGFILVTCTLGSMGLEMLLPWTVEAEFGITYSFPLDATVVLLFLGRWSGLNCGFGMCIAAGTAAWLASQGRNAHQLHEYMLRKKEKQARNQPKSQNPKTKTHQSTLR